MNSAGNGGSPKRRPVVLVDPSPGVTGAFRAAALLAETMSGQLDIALVLPRGSTIAAAELRPFHKVLYLPIVQLRRSPIDLLLYAPALLWTSLALRRALRAPGSALFVNDFYLMHGAAVRMLGFRGKIVTWVRINPDRFPGWLSRFWLARVSRSSSRVVAVSDHIVKAVPGMPEIVRIYDPVIPARQVPAKSASRIADRIVFIANYTLGKGHEMAIAAFALVSHRFPDAELHFHGGDLGLAKNGAFRTALAGQARALGLGERIRFHGFAPDVAAILAEAGIALNFSQSESFSFTCAEASLAGLPVVATRSGGPEEIIDDGVSGYLVDHEDTAAAADAIARLLSDKDRAAAMGKAGSELVRARFAPDVFQRAIRGLFDEDRNVDGGTRDR